MNENEIPWYALAIGGIFLFLAIIAFVLFLKSLATPAAPASPRGTTTPTPPPPVPLAPGGAAGTPAPTTAAPAAGTPAPAPAAPAPTTTPRPTTAGTTTPSTYRSTHRTGLFATLFLLTLAALVMAVIGIDEIQTAAVTVWEKRADHLAIILGVILVGLSIWWFNLYRTKSLPAHIFLGCFTAIAGLSLLGFGLWRLSLTPGGIEEFFLFCQIHWKKFAVIAGVILAITLLFSSGGRILLGIGALIALVYLCVSGPPDTNKVIHYARVVVGKEVPFKASTAGFTEFVIPVDGYNLEFALYGLDGRPRPAALICTQEQVTVILRPEDPIEKLLALPRTMAPLRVKAMLHPEVTTESNVTYYFAVATRQVQPQAP
jgi:hypothetical protein